MDRVRKQMEATHEEMQKIVDSVEEVDTSQTRVQKLTNNTKRGLGTVASTYLSVSASHTRKQDC